MNQDKLKDYELTGSIHTLSVRTNDLIEAVNADVSDCINVSKRASECVTTATVNANKLKGDLFSYHDFTQALDTILTQVGIKDYELMRVDMRFDNYDSDHYKRFAKLNRLLISAMAVTYNVQNCYRANDLFNQQQLSVAIKNRYFELENYDKFAESKGTDPAMSRLEERSKDWHDKDIKREFTEHWFSRWDKAIENLPLVYQKYNDNLLRIYKADKNAYPCRFRSLTDFLIEYQDCIFCKRQMVDLLSQLPEVGNAEERAKNHKRRYGIEYFSKSDVLKAIKEIKRATNEFFGTQKGVNSDPFSNLKVA